MLKWMLQYYGVPKNQAEIIAKYGPAAYNMIKGSSERGSGYASNLMKWGSWLYGAKKAYDTLKDYRNYPETYKPVRTLPISVAPNAGSAASWLSDPERKSWW